MLLKTLTAALLLVAVLGQTSADTTGTPKSGTLAKTGTPKTGTLDKTGLRSSTVPGFLFHRKRFGQVRLFANEGRLYNFDALYNLTSWKRSTYALNSIKSVAITQNASMPVLSVAYPTTSAIFGPYKSVGEVDADIGSNIYTLLINATQYNDRCVVRGFVKLASDMAMELDMDDLGYPGTLFGRVRSLVKGVINTIIESLKGYLEPRLSYLFEDEVLPEKLGMGVNDFCKKMIASTETSFPEPLFDEI